MPDILLLLVSGYLWIGLRPDVHRDAFAVIFVVGAALTLDESALWRHLKDVYWVHKGRQSIDAVVIPDSTAALVLLSLGFCLDLCRAIGRFVGIA